MSNLLTSKYLKEGLGDLLSKPRKVSLQIPTNPKTQQMISLAIDKGIDPETIRRSIGQSNAIPKGEQRFKDWGGIGKVLDVFSRAGENALWQLDEHVVNIVSITHEALQPRTKEEKQLYNYNYYKKVYGEEAAKKYKESGYTKLGAFESLEKEADSETVEKIKKSLSDFAVTKVYNTFEREQLNQFFNDKQMEVAKPLFDADPKLSNWKEYLYTATSGGLSLLEAVGLTLVTGSPTLGAGFLSSIEATESYDNARKAGLMPAEARDVFVLTGGGTFILESFGLEFITNKMVSSRLLHAFLSTGVETVQEELQTVWQNLIERHTYNESKDIFGEWWETAVGIAPSAFVAGFFMPGGSSQQGIRLSQDIAKRANIDRVLADRVVQSMIKSGSVIKDSVFKSLKTPGLTIEDVSKRLEPLAKEARKYKSAEDFVKAQKLVYHGTEVESFSEFLKSKQELATTPFAYDDHGLGFFFTNSQSFAKTFGKNIIPASISIKKPLKLSFNEYTRYFQTGEIKGYQMAPSGERLQEWAKEKGYDSVIVKNYNQRGDEIIAVFDESQIKTKSQLTDIYNQVTKGVEEVEPEIKKPDLISQESEIVVEKTYSEVPGRSGFSINLPYISASVNAPPEIFRQSLLDLSHTKPITLDSVNTLLNTSLPDFKNSSFIINYANTLREIVKMI